MWRHTEPGPGRLNGRHLILPGQSSLNDGLLNACRRIGGVWVDREIEALGLLPQATVVVGDQTTKDLLLKPFVSLSQLRDLMVDGAMTEEEFASAKAAAIARYSGGGRRRGA